MRWVHPGALLFLTRKRNALMNRYSLPPEDRFVLINNRTGKCDWAIGPLEALTAGVKVGIAEAAARLSKSGKRKLTFFVEIKRKNKKGRSWMFFDSITKYVGVSLILLALLRGAEVFELSPVEQIGFSLAAMFFAVWDYTTFTYETTSGESKWRTFCWFCTKFFQFCAVFSIVVVPHMPFLKQWTTEHINRANDLFMLFSLGVVVLLIGLKRDQKINEHFSDMRDGLREIKEIIHENSTQQLKNN